MVLAGGASTDDHIGPYRVERSLGAGGMGEVVEAYDERLDRRVAIKRIRHTADVTAADRARLRREARTAAGLSHPAVVQVYDILSHGDDDAIVMELVRGQTVAALLQAGPLPLAQSLRLALEVAEGLAEAHRIDLVHRDLKAENVMVTPSGHAKILDFGLAKYHHGSLEETLTREGAIVGTVRAMAPEQARGHEVDPRCDLFSLGVLLYEMVTGRSPFRGATALETLRRVVTEAPRPVQQWRPNVPVELARLIEQLLEKAPAHRPSEAGAVARTLEALAAQLVADDTPTPSPPRTGSESFGDAPTGSLLASQWAEVAEEPPRVQVRSSESSVQQALVPRRTLTAALAVFAVALAVLGAVAYWRAAGKSSTVLRVAVLRPEVSASQPLPELDLVASGVRIASLAVLAALDGVAPVEPTGIREGSDTPVEVALAMAADEVLTAHVEGQDGNARIFLQRIRGSDGEVLWASELRVPLRVEHARLVAEAMTVQLLRAYPGSSLRGVPRLEARDEDFSEFVQVTQRIESGQAPLEPELRRLAAIIEGSPGFSGRSPAGGRGGLGIALRYP